MFLFSFDCLFLLNHSDLMEPGTMNLFCSMFYFGLRFIQKWNKPQTQMQLRKLCPFLLLNWKKKEKKKNPKNYSPSPFNQKANEYQGEVFSLQHPGPSGVKKEGSWLYKLWWIWFDDRNKHLCQGGSFRISHQCSEVKWLLKELYGCWNKELFI